MVAGTESPGSVPTAYWIFSASALIICPSPNSSIAIEDNKRFKASSLVIVMLGVILGRFACDTVFTLSQFSKFMNLPIYIERSPSL